jgi:hypothetical protein
MSRPSLSVRYPSRYKDDSPTLVYACFPKAWSRNGKSVKRVTLLRLEGSHPPGPTRAPKWGAAPGFCLRYPVCSQGRLRRISGARGDGASVEGKEDRSPGLGGPTRGGRAMAVDFEAGKYCKAATTPRGGWGWTRSRAGVSWPHVARRHRPQRNHVMRRGGTPVGRPTR